MMQAIFDSLWGWIGIAGVIVICCGVVAWFVPPLRNLAVAIGGVAIAAASIYSKGSRDRAALEKRRREEAIAKAQEKYKEIDKRPDSIEDVKRRLKDGTF